jgi:two-component system KDP operon response regulator KdpE
MKTILIIEDIDSVRHLIRTWLELHGYTVLEAATGRDGVRLFRASPTNMAIVDINLPNGDGIEVIRELRALSAQLIVLVMSGTFDDRELRNAMNMGVHGFLPKPFGMAEFLDQVTKLLDGAAM